ncbi:hypothetical protein [Nocardioides sp.]|uniref:hypothetical protein n=1 Tax=Nocardioides sp. TaxID=35761 RepID=UPI002BBDA753|nr:hypothetical protein [Nocardioides sp.]HXH79757.1 hypothetical protein [Nocardioides sp.]
MDETGDAPRGIDIDSARYSHANEEVAVVARVPDLQRMGSASLSISRFEIFEAGYIVRIIKTRGRPAQTALLYFDHFDATERACDGVRGRWGRSRIRLVVPTECLRGHRTSSLFAQFGISHAERVDHAPAVVRLQSD